MIFFLAVYVRMKPNAGILTSIVVPEVVYSVRSTNRRQDSAKTGHSARVPILPFLVLQEEQACEPEFHELHLEYQVPCLVP